MPSKVETILEALRAALEAGTGAEVVRNEALGRRVPSNGLIILRDGDPGEPEVLMSPLTYCYERVAVAEVFAPSGQDSDPLMMALGAVIAADRTLGGLCDWIEAQAAETGDLDTDGGDTVSAALVPLRIHYDLPDPLA